MFGTKKILKDQDGNKIEPYTVEEAVLSSDGKSIKEKFSDTSNRMKNLEENKSDKEHTHDIEQIKGFPKTKIFHMDIKTKDEDLYYGEKSLYEIFSREEFKNKKIMKNFIFLDESTGENTLVAYKINMDKLIFQVWDIKIGGLTVYSTDIIQKL